MKVVNVILFFVFFLLSSFYAHGITINEIMYDPEGTDSGREWLEIYNEDSIQIDLSAYKLRESNSTHILSAYQGDLVLEPHEYAIIADNAATFITEHSNYQGTLIDSSFSLSNTGELLEILNENSEVVDSLSYESSWGGGGDLSLELKNPLLDNSNSQNWGSSSLIGGTPGEVNSIFVQTSELPEYSWLTALITITAGLAILILAKKK